MPTPVHRCRDAGTCERAALLAGRVMRCLLRAHGRGAAVLVGDPGRTYLPRDHLVPLAAYDVPGVAALEDADRKRTTVWRLA